MKEIKCKGCKPGDSGCSTCGGFKEVLILVTASDGTEYWTRPGVYTSYEGKEWTSFDGVRLRATKDGVVATKEPQL
jgi:hypothetical protein